MRMPRNSFRSKQLGQHFLNSRRIAQRIVDCARVNDAVVLEIGPGKGMLTQYIAEQAKKVYAVELDKALAEKMAGISYPNCTVLHGDFLKLDLRDFEYPIIIGNIPYSITRSIFMRLIEQRLHFARAVLTIQKEYGQRITAEPSTPYYDAITIAVNYCFCIEKGFAIPPRFFSPSPKVSSIVVVLTHRKPLFELQDEQGFFEFIKGIFRYRRKSVRNALRNYLHVVPRGERSLLEKRPNELTVSDYKKLYDCLA